MLKHRLFFSLIIYLIPLLKLDFFICRKLTVGEIKLCNLVFGDLINYDSVQVMNQCFLPWQPAGIIMAPCGAIHLHPNDYRDDFSMQSLSERAIFIHEMAHIYQYQQNINVLHRGMILQIAYYLSFKCYNPYRYQLKLNKNYFCYNIEQQGNIASDIYLGKIKNIIKK